MKNKFRGRTIEGIETDSFKEYCDSWYAVMNPIAEQFGYTVYGFDPDVVFVESNPNTRPELHITRTIHIPAYFAIKLASYIKENTNDTETN